MTNDWQPIDTAPRDGTYILGFANGEMAVVQYIPPTPTWHGYWNLTVVGSYAEDGEWTPTHWHRLPVPPVT